MRSLPLPPKHPQSPPCELVNTKSRRQTPLYLSYACRVRHQQHELLPVRVKGRGKQTKRELKEEQRPPRSTKSPARPLLLNPDVSFHLLSVRFASHTVIIAHRASANSGSSRAPSSYHRKRPRLSATPESRPGSRASGDNQNANQNAATTGSWSSRGSGHPASQHRLPPPVYNEQVHRAPSRRSLSQASIPISALISPHAPSVSRSATFHMRDPRKPAPIQTTPWSLAFPSSGDGLWVERGGSPLHAWLFFIGFVIFPTWWVAAFVGIPKTRRLGGTDIEKSVVLDDPQVEFGE